MTTDIDRPLTGGDDDRPGGSMPEPHVAPGETVVLDPADAPDQDADVTGEPVRPQRSFVKSAREWLIVVIIAITAAVVMKVFVVQQFYVSGHSMDTTLHDLDRVLVNKLSYDLHDPNRGDVVVLEEGIGADERDLIKRVIALPGETIEIKNCVVYIDDRELVEP